MELDMATGLCPAPTISSYCISLLELFLLLIIIMTLKIDDSISPHIGNLKQKEENQIFKQRFKTFVLEAATQP